MNQKACKECGKLFTPRNPRQQYCDDVHYRPCPVCGKPVEIKYLSDPTPRCADCRSKGLKMSTIASKIVDNSVESVENFGDVMRRKYIGKDACKFKHNELMNVRVVKNPPYGYTVEVVEETSSTNQRIMHIASMKSFEYFFKEVK